MLLVAGVLLLVPDLLLFLPLQSLAVHLLIPGRLLFVVLLLAAEVRRCSSPEGPQGYPIKPLGAREPRGYPLRLNRSSLGARGYPLSPLGALLQLGSKRSPRRAAGLSHQALGGHPGTAGLSHKAQLGPGTAGLSHKAQPVLVDVSPGTAGLSHKAQPGRGTAGLSHKAQPELLNLS